MLARLEGAGLIVIDMQPSFLAPIWEADRVLRRCEFLIRAANLLDVPVFATEQYPERMGGTHEALLPHLRADGIKEPGTGNGLNKPEPKMVFSCLGAPSLPAWIEGKSQLVLCGIETMICVNQTAQELRAAGFEVIVAEDAVSGRSHAMHENGIVRMRQAGCEIAHTESIVYEWMRTAEHAAFRNVLKLVKELSQVCV